MKQPTPDTLTFEQIRAWWQTSGSGIPDAELLLVATGQPTSGPPHGPNDRQLRDARQRICDAINALRNHTCCEHPVERHAYNGCASCRCGVRWLEHPGRFFDTDDDHHTKAAVAALKGRP